MEYLNLLRVHYARTHCQISKKQSTPIRPDTWRKNSGIIRSRWCCDVVSTLFMRGFFCLGSQNIGVWGILIEHTKSNLIGKHESSMIWTHCTKNTTDLNSLGPVTHIYASVNWVIIGSGNGLSPVRRQAITWTNAALLSIRLLGINFTEIWIGILSFSLKKMHLKMSSAKTAALLFKGDE